MAAPLTPGAENLPDAAGTRQQSLDAFFAPGAVAVIGATEAPGSVGRTVLRNLASNPFGGTVYPVNPKRTGVLGIKAYPGVAAVPEPVDLAVIVTPAATVPGLVGECIDAGVKAALVISAGFRECGAAGADLERQVRDQLRRGKMRLIGPNCLGVMSPLRGLNATFAQALARPGNVGFLSHSGALCTAILDWSLRENVGFSAFLSIGSMLDVGWGDLINYLGDDPRTESILLYMESVGDARSFLSAAREVAFRKPIIVIKAGRTEGAARAAASHTGSLAGSDEVLEAAFRRTGVLRVDRISDVFYMADVLAKQPRPRGPRLTVLTNAGGPGVLAVDALLTTGGELAPLAPATVEALNGILPPHWSPGNPIDILGDAGPERYARVVQIAAADPGSDGLLVILTPHAMTDPTQTAEHLKLFSRTITHKTDVGGVQLNLADAGAVRRAYLAITAAVRERAGAEHFAGVTVQPMVLADGYELIVGSSIDPQFGPVLLFGSGGQLVEVLKDRALALPPLNTTLARRMMEQTRIYTALKGVRGRKPIDLPALEQLLVRFSQLVIEQPRVREIDVNPLLASPERLLALDARVVVHGPEVREDELPGPVIRPYPTQYVSSCKLKDGTPVTIRPIRPEDEPLMVKFHETLSEQTVYFRYFHAIKLGQRVTHERLARLCFIDYDREMALVAERTDPEAGTMAIIGVGRLTREPGAGAAELAVIVSDRFQSRGLGIELVRRLLQVGREERLGRITADILADNACMIRVCEKLGFRLQWTLRGGVVKAEIAP